jgi:hypothetical protein
MRVIIWLLAAVQASGVPPSFGTKNLSHQVLPLRAAHLVVVHHAAIVKKDHEAWHTKLLQP